MLLVVLDFEYAPCGTFQIVDGTPTPLQILNYGKEKFVSLTHSCSTVIFFSVLK